MTSIEQTHERRVRRDARRHGLRIMKSRQGNPVTSGGYMVVDTATNFVVAGGSPFPYAFDLAEVTDFLREFAHPSA